MIPNIPRRIAKAPKPLHYQRPSYNTHEYWQACAKGWITGEEAQQDAEQWELRRQRAIASKNQKAPTPDRHARPEPFESKQYCKKMSTQAARDDRLTPQAKALLQIIVARTGNNGRVTDTTKTTLGKILSRSPRTIQRYIGELIKFGYIRTQIIKSRKTGLYIALRIWIMNSCLPYYTKKNPRYEPLNWLNVKNNGEKPDETKTSLINDSKLIKNILSEKKPPWFPEFAFR